MNPVLDTARIIVDFLLTSSPMDRVDEIVMLRAAILDEPSLGILSDISDSTAAIHQVC